jgi:hypothetical protein
VILKRLSFLLIFFVLVNFNALLWADISKEQAVKSCLGFDPEKGSYLEVKEVKIISKTTQKEIIVWEVSYAPACPQPQNEPASTRVRCAGGQAYCDVDQTNGQILNKSYGM